MPTVIYVGAMIMSIVGVILHIRFFTRFYRDAVIHLMSTHFPGGMGRRSFLIVFGWVLVFMRVFH